mmetsp:Transcript_28124/g.81304  ORF Transcript_28124/g.81304 Transcript_28124/m.81304 type:complete len:99 (+) Transcript_28124:230-526(+)|eukprot:CAMPEP_0181047818 /NCGR_PEP_ID=MMETSP1070-20121207/15092_1 /TAXON_ID=265543 /ORGANISM="Minutocellus polymorphus, Strain NH13" /LENGTH=98 /DNA_ID=CAMNT_0023126535 /DNA_START=158 /DNA_END=454 /DNA_ORIENTATION=+
MFGRKRRKDCDSVTVDSRVDDGRPWKLNFHMGFEDGDARCGKTKEVALLQTNLKLPSCGEIVDVSTAAFTWALDQAVDLPDRVVDLRESMPRLELTPN